MFAALAFALSLAASGAFPEPLFEAARSFTTELAAFSFSVVTGDLNSDGTSDLVVLNTVTNDVTVLLGQGDGTFQEAASYPVGAFPNQVALGFLDDNGTIDIITANQGSISVLLG
ncbi:MAG TPA: VCBS repeat-containing protein, partial [Candidatus Dormibacteraeota bacterium]|nr:VCBS repeat-containing protein [Candidatus Dormibacteraeota bacterium]